MASTAPSSPTKSPKPKKMVMSTGRGGGGNFRKVKEKTYVTETAKNASTTKKVLEVEPPRFKAAYSGRGGAGNKWDHVLEDGVFNRVMQYELSKVQPKKVDGPVKRQSLRSRTFSNAARSTRKSTDGTDSAPTNVKVPSVRDYWASRSNIDLSSHGMFATHSHEHKKNLRETLLAPLKTSFMRRRSAGSVSVATSVHEDASSFSAGSSSESRRAPSTIELSIATSQYEVITSLSPNSEVSFGSFGDYYGYGPQSASAIPSTVDILEDFTLPPIPRRRSTGAHRSPRTSRLAPPLPSPTTPLPPTPSTNVIERTSLPATLPGRLENSDSPALPRPPPVPTVKLMIPVKSLKATAAPVTAPMQIKPLYSPSSPTSHSALVAASATASASSSQDRLTVPAGSSLNRAPNRKLYNDSIAARSVGALPLHLAASREASFYAGSDVDRIDPSLPLPNLTEQEERYYDSLLPWLKPPNTTLSSVSSISIPSFNESSPELVAA